MKLFLNTFNITCWCLWITLKPAAVDPVCSSAGQHVEMFGLTAVKTGNSENFIQHGMRHDDDMTVFIRGMFVPVCGCSSCLLNK